MKRVLGGMAAVACLLLGACAPKSSPTAKEDFPTVGGFYEIQALRVVDGHEMVQLFQVHIVAISSRNPDWIEVDRADHGPYWLSLAKVEVAHRIDPFVPGSKPSN